jgi:hypothetical protein
VGTFAARAPDIQRATANETRRRRFILWVFTECRLGQ